MRVASGFTDLALPHAATVATIGNFDGAHLGHRRIFERTLARSRTLGCPALAVTFDPHPIAVLRPDRTPRLILTPEQKREILEEAGFDTLVVIPFSPAIAEVEPERFVEEFLVAALRIRELYIGVDFRFGRDRRGDLALLKKSAAGRFLVESVETVHRDGQRISASRIREALERGEVRAAAEMMGRPYEARGEVVRGAGRGRGHGAPTANLRVANGMVPGHGVYLTETIAEGASHPSLTNIGTRPTFEGAGYAVETWLPDYSGDLYGRSLRVLFHERIRDERKFPSPEALREQIDRDLKVMREFFAARRAGPERDGRGA